MGSYGSYQAPRRKVQKEKKKYFPFLLAGSEKLLTFATPIRTKGSGIQSKRLLTEKEKKVLAKRKRMPNFGSPNKG